MHKQNSRGLLVAGAVVGLVALQTQATPLGAGGVGAFGRGVFPLAAAVVKPPQKPDRFAGERAKAQAVACLSNARQIGIAFNMYAADFNKRTPAKGVSYTGALSPYVPNKKLYTCPLDKVGTVSYTFNDNIAGIPLYTIPTPSKTVLIYEGRGGKLNFRHSGRAAVGFADGHCVLVNKMQAAGLIWKVKIVKAQTP